MASREYLKCDTDLVRAMLRNGSSIKQAAHAIDRTAKQLSAKNRAMTNAGDEPMWQINPIISKSFEANRAAREFQVLTNADATLSRINSLNPIDYANS